jgi:thiamine biosynthesis lipoprotein
LKRFEEEFPAMGVRARVVAYAASDANFDYALSAVRQRVGELEKCLSDYDPESEVNRFCDLAPHTVALSVSDDLFRICRLSQTYFQWSDGSFDPTVAPLTRIWRHARKRNRPPNEQRISAARASVGFDGVEITEPNKMRLLRPGMRLDFGGIAKGFATEECCRLLQRQGIESVLVELGGDIRLTAAPPDKSGWTIEIQDATTKAGTEKHQLLLVDSAVASSGDLFQRLQEGDVIHSHILDPRTGQSVKHVSSVTVVATDGSAADAIATALSVMDVKKGIELVENLTGVEARIVFRQSAIGGESSLAVVETDGFRELRISTN